MEYSTQIKIGEAIPETKKYLPQYTKIFFPSTKIIIQINSKLTRDPILG
jgi:hypothetical protein